MALATAHLSFRRALLPFGNRKNVRGDLKRRRRLNSFSPRYLLLSGVFRRSVWRAVFIGPILLDRRDRGPLSKHHFGGR